MLHSLSKIACCLLLVTILVTPQSGVARKQIATIDALASFFIPGSKVSKFPHVAAAGNRIHVVGSVNETATYWTKQDSAPAFEAPAGLGLAGDKPDFTAASAMVSFDGSVNVAWINNGTDDPRTKGVYMRRKPANGDWEPQRTVAQGDRFRAYAEIAVANSGVIFVVWFRNQPNARIVYSFSPDGGVTWSPEALVADIEPYDGGNIATSADGKIMVTFAGSDGNIYGGLWNGAAFAVELIAQENTRYFSNPNTAIGPNGTIYVAWRDANESGIYFSERQPNGSWPRSRLMSGKINATIGLAVDQSNGLHIAWVGNQSGSPDMYYTYRPLGGNFEPVHRTAGGGRLVNSARAAATSSDRIYGHAVFEYWDGDPLIRYNLYGNGIVATPTPTQVPISAQPKLLKAIENGKDEKEVPIGFENVVGSPTQVRFHWDAPPTDADTFQTFATSMLVKAPPGLPTDKCTEHTLYTQVRNGTMLESPPKSAKVTFDTAVQAGVVAANPYMTGLPSVYSKINPADVFSEGSSDGDPRYSRKQSFFITVYSTGDCSKLKSLQVGNQAPLTISNNIHTGAPPLPNPSTSTPTQTFSILVTDTLGFSRLSNHTIFYDPPDVSTTGDGLGRPVLTGTSALQLPTITTATTSTNNVNVTLNFNNIHVTDNLYGSRPGENLPKGKQFWGVFIAVKKSASSASDPPANDPNLNWFPARVLVPNSSFSVQWSLLSGHSGSWLTGAEGRYVIFARAVDGAGNPSTLALKTSITLNSNYSSPTIRLPSIIRP